MTFKELNIIEPILKAITAQGYTEPTPIQEKSIPSLLKKNDLLGCAQTGTGKTAAFAIPILQHIYNEKEINSGKRKIQALIVTPTRELAIQIADSFTTYGKYTGIRNTVIFGGVKQGAQTDVLQKGVDILTATPGRLLDLIQQGFVSLQHIKYFVLDEADQMLDMGFIHDIKRIIEKLPKQRQSLFFSATMPKDIVELSNKILGNPQRVTITPEQTTAEKVEQSVYFVSKKSKANLLNEILKNKNYFSVLVFSRTKYGADKITTYLKKNKISAEAIHGNKTQGARQRALGNFKNGDTQVLVATDIAARGIDVSGLSLVVNYDLPNVPETYIHRIGRTGRANAEGIAISFCDNDEKSYWISILKLIKQEIPVVTEHSFADEVDPDLTKDIQKPQKQQNTQNRRKPAQETHNSERKNKTFRKPKIENRKFGKKQNR